MHHPMHTACTADAALPILHCLEMGILKRVTWATLWARQERSYLEIGKLLALYLDL